VLNVLWWLLLCAKRFVVVTAVCQTFCGGYCCVLNVLWWLLLCAKRFVVVTAVCQTFCGGYCCVPNVLFTDQSNTLNTESQT
jgi:hypothetical protein